MRRGNIFGVFEADRDLAKNKTVLIVDDVTTTGCTLNECAKMLNFSGAFKVYCAVAAKTVMHIPEAEMTEKGQSAEQGKDLTEGTADMTHINGALKSKEGKTNV